MASEGLTGDRIRRDPVSKPGSSELDFRRYHTRRQQWSGFFCLPTGAGFRGVRGGVSLGPVWICSIYETK